MFGFLQLLRLFRASGLSLGGPLNPATWIFRPGLVAISALVEGLRAGLGLMLPVLSKGI